MLKALSLIIPVYNSQETLKSCLDSVFSSISSEDEVILVDDGSTDLSHEIASRFPCQIVRLLKNSGAAGARNAGACIAKNEILVFLDSDVLINAQNIQTVREYLSLEKEVHSITANLSANSISGNFFTDYKNLYMNYIFSRCEQPVNFIYGAFCATLKERFIPWPIELAFAEDSVWGYQQRKQGLNIHLLKDVTVLHLKKYTLLSLIKNDFNISRHFSYCFLQFNRWRTLYTFESFGHTSKNQKLSLILAVITSALFLNSSKTGFLTLLIWALLNFPFFHFLGSRRNLFFTIKSAIWTFVDHHIYFAGIVSGVLFYIEKTATAFATSKGLRSERG